VSIEVKTLPRAETSTQKIAKRPNHIVELDDEGRPTDQCLCGHLWDRAFVKHDPEGGICQECVEELRRRGQA